jgi:Flp pilus assembly pilin Flp
MDHDDNPFRAPSADARPDLLDDDRVARTRLLGAEARIIAVGTLWTVAATLQLLFTVPAAIFSFGNGVVNGGPATFELYGAGAYYVISGFILSWYLSVGRDLRDLVPMPWYDLRWWVLLGVCCGPCSAVNLIIPFLVLNRDAAAVLTPEYAALRERTPDLEPPTTTTLVVLVGGLASVVFVLSLVMIVVLSSLGETLAQNFEDVGQAIPGDVD